MGQGGHQPILHLLWTILKQPLGSESRNGQQQRVNDCHGLWGGTAELLQMDRNAMLPYRSVMGTL